MPLWIITRLNFIFFSKIKGSNSGKIQPIGKCLQRAYVDKVAIIFVNFLECDQGVTRRSGADLHNISTFT